MTTPAPDPTPAPAAAAPAASSSLGSLWSGFLSDVQKPGQIRKWLATVFGLVGIGLAQGLIQGTAAKWAAVAINVAVSIGVYVLPNDKPAGSST